MSRADRLAKRQGRREDLGALAGLILFVVLILSIVVLPGFLVEDASSVRVPAQHEARR